MIINTLVVAACAALALAAVGVQASPMFQYNGSDIVGVTGVDVNGVTYNASFLDAPFGYLYSNDPAILYSDSFAVAASSALYGFISTVDLSTYQASDFRGCSGWDICYLFTAYLIEDNLA